MKAIDPIIDADLDAYVDGELDVSRRIQVESYLSENPAIAAKVMADLSMKGELRLALAGESAFGRRDTRCGPQAGTWPLLWPYPALHAAHRRRRRTACRRLGGS